MSWRGLILVGGGFLLLRPGVFEGTRVEVPDEESQQQSGEIIVEIAGAVEEPGVYKLLASNRVERLLIVSGGLSAETDRDWVARNLNKAVKLAEKLTLTLLRRASLIRSGG